MNIWHIIITIIVVVILAGLFSIMTRNKDTSKKEAFWLGVYTGGFGCIIPLLWNIFMFFVSIAILYMIYSWIFG